MKKQFGNFEKFIYDSFFLHQLEKKKKTVCLQAIVIAFNFRNNNATFWEWVTGIWLTNAVFFNTILPLAIKRDVSHKKGQM